MVAQNDLGLLCYHKKVDLFPHFSFFIPPQIFGRSCCGHLLERFLWTGLLRDFQFDYGGGIWVYYEFRLHYVLDLGIGPPVNGFVQSLKRLPPRLVEIDLGIGSPVNG